MFCAENCNFNICQRVFFFPACRSLLLLSVSQWMVPAFPVLSRAVRTWLTDTRLIRRGSRPHQETPLGFLMATDSLFLVVNLLTAPLCFPSPCLSFGNNGLNPHLRELKKKNQEKSACRREDEICLVDRRIVFQLPFPTFNGAYR